MADNRYGDYLDNKRNDSNSGYGGLATIGAIGAGAALAASPGLRRGTMDALSTIGVHAGGGALKIASYLNRTGRVGERMQGTMAFIKSFDHALDNRSPLSHWMNPGRFEERFDDMMRRELTQTNRSRASQFGGKPMQIEKRYQQMQGDLKMGSYTYFNEVRRQLVTSDLARTMPQHADQLAGILGQQNDRFFTDPGHDKIRGILERYNGRTNPNTAYKLNVGAHEEDNFINKMMDSLSAYQNTKNYERNAVVKRGGGTYDGVSTQGAASLAKRIKDGFLRDNQVKDTFLSKMMRGAGFRQATVKDMLEQDASGKWVNKLFENDSIIAQRAKGARRGQSYELQVGDKLAALANRKGNTGILDLAVDHSLFINEAGQFKDMRGMTEGIYNAANFLQKNFQVPFLRFNPLDLMHWTTFQAIKEAAPTYLLRRGTIHPILQGTAETLKHPSLHNQDAAATPLAKDYIYTGNQVFDLVSGKTIKDDVYLTSARFGTVPRALASMANLHRKDLRNRSFMGSLLDVGAQETEHLWNRMASTFTKFDDPNWARNRYRALLGADSTTPRGMVEIESSYKDLYAELNMRAEGFSYDTAKYINDHVKRAYGSTDVDLMKLHTPQEVMETFGRIGRDIASKDGRLVRDELEMQIGKMWNEHTTNEQEFLKNKRIISDNAPYMMGPLQAVDTHETRLVSKIDDVRRLIHQHSMLQLERREGISVGDLVQQGIQSGHLGNEALDSTRDLRVLTGMQEYWEDIYKNGPMHKDDALKQFHAQAKNDPSFRSSLADSIERHSPIWAMGPGDQPPQHFGFTGSTVVNKARGHRWFMQNLNEQMQQGINPLAAAGKAAWGVLGQPFSGRKNLGDVTTASIFGYYFAERLDNMAAKIGLGLSQANRGSMQSILGNQFLRRIVLPYAGIQQLQYLDGLTGDTVSDKAADTYANMTTDAAWLKDVTGINSIGKWLGGLMPGSDQFWSTPIGGVIKYGSFGLFGDTRSADEMKQYYESGEDPIRKGRWWGIGSNTPWEGGKIDRYLPNWYRRLKSDYQFTDTMYGSESEYWANSWMPTLTHPLAPLRHFLTDPDHWANKHKDDRPYPVTGGIDELGMIPVIGPVVNRTIGGILNPYRERGDLSKAHLQYQEEINKYIQSQYDSALGGGQLQMMPAGGYQILSESTGFGGGFGEGLSSLTAPGQAEGYGTGGRGGASGSSMAYLTAINLAMTGAGAGTAGGIMAPARPINSLDDLRDPDTIADLRDMVNPYSTGQTSLDQWYNLTEMAGIYGFSANMFAGVDTNKRSQALDRAGRMTSYNRAWWDMEMGGLGGDVSELFRRYVPRDPRKQYYNPYRNKMPDWMPGVNYFIDFQHGDPYTKVPNGEIRLPGSAYESMNQLHPDQFGDYGAFDRFKILADAAPYSDEYKFWRRMVGQMNQQGMLNDKEVEDYATVRDQVASKKEKYHLYPYKFQNAEVIKETVRITKVLDANTFLTAEHPNNPIRLANVHVKSDATDAQEWLQQYIHEGAQVQIGIDSDPLNRVRDDTMNTMHAVVYSNGEDDSYFSTKGQSLNAILARRNWEKKDSVTFKQENTAVGTAAMYDKADITAGKVNEWLVHSMLPNIPILGTIFDKFMQVRSPLEMYKKNEVYGKSWRPWTDPWKGWIQPMLETAATKNPLVAAAQGYGLGWMFGKATKGKYIGKWTGAAVFGLVAAARSIDEFIGHRAPGGENYAWIPERRQKERSINEYFDVLKYMKYKGLYERAKDEAKDAEGIDLDQIFKDNETRGGSNKKTRKYLDAEKKWLSISNKLGYVDEDVIQEQLDKVRAKMKGIDEDRPNMAIGPRAMQALQYKLQYESTLYGADPNGDMTKIFRALPNKDREFFQNFMTASPDEREEILRLVPKDQKRFYQAKWGMKTDDKESLSSYFMSHYLPSTSWEGWRPDVNLDDIKLKVVRNEGLESTEFGMWDQDAERSDASGVQAVQPFRPSMTIDIARITKVLQGSGLTDVDVTMNSSPSKDGHGLSVAFDLIRDRTDDIKNELSNNLGSLFA